MMRILIATDGETYSDQAVKAAEILTSLGESKVTILTVARSESDRKSASVVIDRALQMLEIDPARLEGKIHIGQVAEEITAEALNGAYDLIVLGQRPHHGLMARIFGPVTQKVVEQVDLPVMIIKEPLTSLSKMLLCDGGGTEVPLLDRFAKQLPLLPAFAQEVTVLHVMSQIGATPGINGEHLRATAEELMADNSPEGELLEEDIKKLENLKIEPQVLVRHGLVVDEILQEAEKGAYDLVVIGAHRQETWPKFLLDDLAGQIVQKISQSILVIQ